MRMSGIVQTLLVMSVLAWSGMASAQSGLASRPLNLTCIAPAMTQQALQTTRTRISAPTYQRFSQGRDAGVAYRGINVPLLQGQYIYLQNGKLMSEFDGPHGVIAQALPLEKFSPVSMVEGDDSEIYLLDKSGATFALAQAPQHPNAAPAALLSQTGCFDVNDPSIPAAGLIPYQPTAGLWSDDAVKRRWIAMPDWNALNTQITVLADGDFEFPVGTILLKEFKLGATIVETRLLIKDLGGTWMGYSYEWNSEQTDAVLLSAGKTVDINGQQWSFPYSFECTFCHSTAANVALGPEIAQLNKDFLYVDTGITANQLTTLDSIGLIAGGLSAPPAQLDALPAYDDVTAPIDERARGYLHSNCGNCHRPGAQGQGPADFRYQLDGTAIGVNDVTPWLGDLGVTGAKLLMRGSPELSILSVRMKNLNFTRMPPLGTVIADTQGVTLIDDWITSGLGFGIGDADGDIKADDLDNCSAVANPSQLDSNADGFGNLCDADLNNDNIVNFLDLGIFSNVFQTNDPDADFNGDGIVNFLDFPILVNSIFGPPGPSGLQP